MNINPHTTAHSADDSVPVVPPALRDDPWHIQSARIVQRREEVEGVITLDITLDDEGARAEYLFAPGQFNMLYAFGVGEAAISIASSSANPALLSHTIRMVGQVTNALGRVSVGGSIGLRGPFGSHWPVERARGGNLILIAGGIGLPPLRPVIDRVIRNRVDYDRVALVYGAKTVSDLLYPYEYDLWKRNGIEMIVTVDRADDSWKGERGVVPAALKKLRLRGSNHTAFMCGPEIMMKYAVQECLNREVAEDSIFVSLERNMKCACTFCGHCQIGPEFVCRDGPIFSYAKIKHWFCREGF